MSDIVKICKKHGGLTAEWVNKGNRCKHCNIERTRQWKEDNKEKHKASANRKRNTDPEAKAKRNERERENRKLRPEIFREQGRRHREKLGSRRNAIEIARRRGITVEQYDQLLQQQNYLCAICEQPEKRLDVRGKVSQLALDHNHKTGKVREFLCHDCNTAIGKYKEDISIIQNAIFYLKRFKGVANE